VNGQCYYYAFHHSGHELMRMVAIFDTATIVLAQPFAVPVQLVSLHTFVGTVRASFGWFHPFSGCELATPGSAETSGGMMVEMLAVQEKSARDWHVDAVGVPLWYIAIDQLGNCRKCMLRWILDEACSRIAPEMVGLALKQRSADSEHTSSTTR
jgi:hypothetical protein